MASALFTALHQSSWFCCLRWTTSKQLGIGTTERSWKDVKQIKDGKQSNLGGVSLEKRAILYSSARLNEAKIRANHGDNEENDLFGNDDINIK